MGHSSIQITVDLYGHLIPGGNKQAVDRLDMWATDSVSAPMAATPAQPAKLRDMTRPHKPTIPLVRPAGIEPATCGFEVTFVGAQRRDSRIDSSDHADRSGPTRATCPHPRTPGAPCFSLESPSPGGIPLRHLPTTPGGSGRPPAC